MRWVERILNYIQAFVIAMCVVFVVGLTGLMFATTVMRYFIGSAVPYTMMILTGFMVWMVFLLLGSVARRNEHLRISLLPDIILKKRADGFVAFVENLVGLPLCIYMTWVGVHWIDFRIEQGTRYMIGYTDSYPAWIPNIVLPIGFALASLFYLERSIRQLLRFYQIWRKKA
ncbi:MAG: TRAP transporter small permease [Chloroflexi bacterium]|nr:TRAP transporter small permease [Chloroflexota bacterium]